MRSKISAVGGRGAGSGLDVARGREPSTAPTTPPKEEQGSGGNTWVRLACAGADAAGG